jgi:hypothetical protein
VPQGITRRPQHGAEAPRIVESQHAARRQTQIDVIVASRRNARGRHPQAAGHAQVDDEGAASGFHEQILGSSADPEDPLAGQFPIESAGYRPAQLALTDGDAVDDLAVQPGFDAAARRFNFGQFRHDRGIRPPGRMAGTSLFCFVGAAFL